MRFDTAVKAGRAIELSSPVAERGSESRAQYSGDVRDAAKAESAAIPIKRMPVCATRAVVQRRTTMLRKRKQQKQNDQAMLPVMRPNAAGIDIGATEIVVAVPTDRDPQHVRCFPPSRGIFTRWRIG
jgi:hypothetical protein